jgi:ribose-phosphate pyrophosphokinase
MRPLLVSGSAHPSLAAEVARELACDLVPCLCERFPDGEQEVEVRASVRGQGVFILQPLGPPVGEHLLELLLLGDACRRAGAASLTAIVPYVGFARQDRITREGQPLGARVLAEALGTGKFSQIVAVDLHSPVMASSADVPITHITAVPAIVDALRPMVSATSVVVAPDRGAVRLADGYARALRLPLSVVSKVRTSPIDVAVQSVVGDVRGRRLVVVDDMISTGRTIDAAIDASIAHGCCASGVIVAATHGLFVVGAADRLNRSEVERTVVSDSLPASPHAPAHLRVVGLAPLLAEVVRRIAGNRGLDDLLVVR